MKRVLLILLFGAGCHETVQAPDGHESAAQELLEGPTLEPVSVTAFDVERATKEAWSKPVQITDVDWSDAVAHPKIAADLLSSEQVAKLDGIKMPVLLPNEPALLQAANIVTGEHWYSASMQANGITVVIHGSKAAHNVDLKVPEKTLELMRNFTVYRTHEIVTLTFTMYNVAYALDIECANPVADDRCNKDETIMQMAENLVLAGGAQ